MNVAWVEVVSMVSRHIVHLWNDDVYVAKPCVEYAGYGYNNTMRFGGLNGNCELNKFP